MIATAASYFSQYIFQFFLFFIL